MQVELMPHVSRQGNWGTGILYIRRRKIGRVRRLLCSVRETIDKLTKPVVSLFEDKFRANAEPLAYLCGSGSATLIIRSRKH
jgi:hypothetical protein